MSSFTQPWFGVGSLGSEKSGIRCVNVFEHEEFHKALIARKTSLVDFYMPEVSLNEAVHSICSQNMLG
jgi:hypothetical protein